MPIPTRTPEGRPGDCPVCGASVVIEPTLPTGDAPCPNCGTLLWLVVAGETATVIRFDDPRTRRLRDLEAAASKRGLPFPKSLGDESFRTELGIDSLEAVELIMEFENAAGPA